MGKYGAESAPKGLWFPRHPLHRCVPGYPWESGVRVQAGDLIKLDVAAEKDEFYADAALTIRAGRDGAETDAWVP